MRKNIYFKYVIIAFFVFTINLYSEEVKTPRKELSEAIKNGNINKVKSLIETSTIGIDEEKDTYSYTSPLTEAAENAKIDIIKYLIEKGASINGIAKGPSPLVKFIEGGIHLSFENLINAVNFMIENGANVNGCESDKYTPLMAACEHISSIDLIELLINNGANINAKSTKDDTAYLLSLRNNNIKAYRLLISLGANINETHKGMLPLSYLAFYGNTYMIKTLLNETQANVNEYNPNGTTPIMCATLGNQNATIEFLIEKGANTNSTTLYPLDIEIPNKWGFSFSTKYVAFPKGSTALNFAKTLGSISTANLLTELGGTIYKEVEYKEVSSWLRYPYK